ncbi:hypothetical protein KUCAC02_037761, partial [Chaenocephalus aceratus]
SAEPKPELPPSYSPPASPTCAGAPEPELSSSSLPPHPEPTPSDNVTSTPGCETLAELHVSENAQYTHNDIVLDMQCAINNVQKEDLIAKENG